MNELDWLNTLKDEVSGFLEHQKSKIKQGYYAYSYSGDIYDETINWNVGSSVFALKLYYVLGFKKDKTIIDTCNYIKEFLHSDGQIYDNMIYKKGFLRNFAASLKNKDFTNPLNTQYKRAETRQSYSVLMLYDELPKNVSFDFPKSEDEIDKYLSKLNWNEPWGAGSHFSHLMFFYKLGLLTNNIDEDTYKSLVDYSITWIDKIRHKDTGGWYKGKQENRYIVNGAMKILTGLGIRSSE